MLEGLTALELFAKLWLPVRFEFVFVVFLVSPALKVVRFESITLVAKVLVVEKK